LLDLLEHFLVRALLLLLGHYFFDLLREGLFEALALPLGLVLVFQALRCLDLRQLEVHVVGGVDTQEYLLQVFIALGKRGAASDYDDVIAVALVRLVAHHYDVGFAFLLKDSAGLG